MRLTVEPDVCLELKLLDPDADNPSGSYLMVGPKEELEMLEKITGQSAGAAAESAPATSPAELMVSDVTPEGEPPEPAPAAGAGVGLVIRGMLSPVGQVTLPPECQRAAGIPAGAHTFCFTYPAEGMEEHLEKLNLTDEPWGYFLLVGGFIFFREDGSLLSCAALTLFPSKWMLHFDGPYQPTRTSLKQLQDSKRMLAITLDALENAGFEAFGWVHAYGPQSPAEKCFLKCEEQCEYKHGGFVYDMAGDEHNFFTLREHTPDELEEFREACFDIDDPQTKYRFGIFGRWYEGYQRDHARARKETDQMNKLTQAATGHW